MTQLIDGYLGASVHDHLQVVAESETRDPGKAKAALGKHEIARKRAL